MAKKPTKPAADDETPERKDHKALLLELRKNYDLCVSGDRHNRDSYKQALKFCYVKGEQWEQAVKTARGPNRVTREFNETRPKVKLVVNHIRSNRPTAKISPVEQGDVDTAECMNGLWLNSWSKSDADNITDFAAETQVAAGMGAWMVETDYTDGGGFDQDICWKSIRNPLCLYPDYACKEQDKSDARFWVYHTKMPKDVYSEKYKGAEVASFEPEELGDNDPNDDDDSVWVAAYWKKLPVTRTLCMLSTGETVDKDELGQLPEAVTIVKERKVKGHKIVQYICSADAVLEGPNEWAGSEFPFVIVYGEYVVVDGKTYWGGMTQTLMDAQRSHNEAASGVYETIAASSMAEDWATTVQAEGLMNQWYQSRNERIGVRLYNHDPQEPGPPKRSGGPDVPVAMIQAMEMSRGQINSISITPDALQGLASNESSGRAIRARQDSGLVGTYNYSDNIAKAIGRSCKIFIDLAPKVIDTQRVVRILGKDGAEKYMTVNQFDPVTGKIVNDLSKGKYDFVVTQGPNVQTQRQEAAETLTSLAQSDALLMPTAGDIVYRNLDIPGAQEIAERRRAMLPPQIQQMINKDAPEDPRVVAAMQQVEQLQAQLQEQAAAIQEAGAQAQTDTASANKAKADVQIALANLKTEQANLATEVARFQALVANTQAKFAQQDAADVEAKTAQQAEASAAERDTLTGQLTDALLQIQQQSAEHGQAIQALAQELVAQQAAVSQPKASGPKTAVTHRVDGGFDTIVTDGATGEKKVARSRKVNGQMVTHIEPTLQ